MGRTGSLLQLREKPLLLVLRMDSNSMRLVLVPEGQDKAGLCERGRDVCSGALPPHLLTDLDGAMSGLANRAETVRKQQ